MKKLSFVVMAIVLVLHASCSVKKEAPLKREGSPLDGRLASFFTLCAKDAESGAKVVQKHDIVKMLTHFLRMDGGGKKYYLLEREHISEMILAVTEGLYSDFILINRHGVVVYSRENDDIFGKNVRSALSDGPLARCFARQDQDLYIEDVAVFPPGSGRYGIFVSSRIVVEDSFHGILVLQAGIEKVEGYLDGKTEILDYEGRYRISPRRELIMTEHPLYERMKQGASGSLSADGKRFDYHPFEFRGIRWLIVGER